MQKKILLPLLLVIGIGGVAFAAFLNPKNLPDTAEFPRIPMGSGTIGQIIGKILGTTDLGNYAGDGTASNTQTLSGVTATGYLKNNLCTATQVWTGFDTTGKAQCGNKHGLLSYGTISAQDCGATVYRTDGTSAATHTGDTLKEGDIIKTSPACGLTIAFMDTSILRLDQNTTASLDLSSTSIEPNKPIASLLLESGQVWGRILSPDNSTSTGYTIGTDEVVAGVRGTSLAIYKPAGTATVAPNTGGSSKWKITTTNPSAATDVVVVHSRIPANTLTGVIQITAHDGTKTIMNPGDKISYNSTPSSLHPTLHTLVDLYTTTPWIRDNTKKDLDYLTNPPSINPNIGTANLYTIRTVNIPNELVATKGTSTAIKNALCDTGNIFWNSLLGTAYNKCQPTTLLTFVDFTGLKIGSNTTAPLMYLKSDTPLTAPTTIAGLNDNSFTTNPSQNDIQTGTGYKIEENGEYISYDVSSLSGAIGGFSGKTITLTLSDPVGTYGRTNTDISKGLIGNGPKWYIADFGNFRVYKRSSDNTYWTTLCTSPSTCTDSPLSETDEKNITFKIPVNINSTPIIIGNIHANAMINGTSTSGYWFPIGSVIEKITIQ